MKITFEKLDAKIDLNKQGKALISGSQKQDVEIALKDSYGFAGHIFNLENTTDYDLYSAVISSLNKYQPVFEYLPVVPAIPEATDGSGDVVDNPRRTDARRGGGKSKSSKKRGRGTGKKRKNCEKGITCGGSCIARTKVCRKDGNATQRAVAKKIRASAGGGATASTQNTVTQQTATTATQQPEATQKSLTDRPNTGKHSDVPSDELKGGNSYVYEMDKATGKTYRVTLAASGKEKNREEISQQEYKDIVINKFKGNVNTAQYVGEDARPPDVVNRLKAEAKAKQTEAVMRLSGLDQQSASNAIESIKAYTDPGNELGYTAIRNVQRGINKKENDEDLSPQELKLIQDRIRNINNYIETAPTYNGVVYRGMTFDTKSDRDSFIQSIANGYSLEAMSSFSSSKTTAKNFAADKGGNGILFAVQNRSGVSVKGISNVKEEDEVLVPRGAKYRIIDTKQQGANLLVQLEELD